MFTQAELDAMRAADAEIEADFSLTEWEIAAAEDRDERAIYARLCERKASAPKSMRERESDFQRFKARRKRTYTPEQRERMKVRVKAYYEAHKEQIRRYKVKWYQANREEILSKQAAYRKANRSKRTAYRAAWRQRRKEAANREASPAAR